MEREHLDNHQRAIWDEAYSNGYKEGKDALAEALHAKPKNSDERRAFIREAAIALGVAFRMRDPILHMALSDAKVAWDAARLLWDAKPEDC